MPINNDRTLSTEWTDVHVLLDSNGGIVQIVDANFESLTRPGSGPDAARTNFKLD